MYASLNACWARQPEVTMIGINHVFFDAATVMGERDMGRDICAYDHTITQRGAVGGGRCSARTAPQSHLSTCFTLRQL